MPLPPSLPQNPGVVPLLAAMSPLRIRRVCLRSRALIFSDPEPDSQRCDFVVPRAVILADIAPCDALGDCGRKRYASSRFSPRRNPLVLVANPRHTRPGPEMDAGTSGDHSSLRYVCRQPKRNESPTGGRCRPQAGPSLDQRLSSATVQVWRLRVLIVSQGTTHIHSQPVSVRWWTWVSQDAVSPERRGVRTSSLPRRAHKWEGSQPAVRFPHARGFT